MFVLFGLVLLFDHQREHELGSADESVELADEVPAANVAAASDEATEAVELPLYGVATPGGVNG